MVSRQRRSARRRLEGENPHLSPLSTPRLQKKKEKITLEGGAEKRPGGGGGGGGGKLKRKMDGACFVCHSQSHLVKDCPERVQGEGCFVCQSLDHKARSCPKTAEREKKKKVPRISSPESLPERPGARDCPYENCTFGPQCKYNHPKNKAPHVSSESLPERPGQPDCPYEKCTFGLRCKYNHPKNEESGSSVKTVSTFTPSLLHNSKAQPIQPGEVDCPFYLMTGSCQKGTLCRHNHPERNAINLPVAVALGQEVFPYSAINQPIGTLCRHNHPERNAINLPVAVALGQEVFPYSAINQPIGVINHAVSLLPNSTPLLNQRALGVGPTVYLPQPGEMSYKIPHISPPESLPERPGQPNCPYEKCTFGLQCKYDHPKNKMPGSSMNRVFPFSPPLLLNSKGLPIRPGEEDCPFYLMTGKCKKGALCQLNHPVGNGAINPPGAVASGQALMSSSTSNQPIGVVNPATSLLPNITPLLNQTALGVSPSVFPQRTGQMICDLGVSSTVFPQQSGEMILDLGVGPTVFPQRPGEMICDAPVTLAGAIHEKYEPPPPGSDKEPSQKHPWPTEPCLICHYIPIIVYLKFYMKTGNCQFGGNCKFHHPIDRPAPTPPTVKQAVQQDIKLTLAGLPRREGSVFCRDYMNTGICIYGADCKYDHPTPAEAIARTTLQRS